MPKDNYTWKDGSKGVVTVEWTIARKAVEFPEAEQDLTYTGKKQTGIKEGEGYTLTGDFTGKKAGKYTARAILSNNYIWKDGSTKAVTVKWSIAKADQKITVKKASASYKASALKKKDKTFQIGAKAKGKLTYKVTKAPKNASKYVTVNKNGKVTVKKNAPAGTWKITVTAASGSNYNKATKVITVKVKK